MVSAMATVASIQGFAPCSTSSLQSSFRTGTKLCVKVPAMASPGVLQSGPIVGMSTGNGNGTGKTSGAPSGEPRLGSHGCPLYTTLAGIPVSDDNNR